MIHLKMFVLSMTILYKTQLDPSKISTAYRSRLWRNLWLQPVHVFFERRNVSYKIHNHVWRLKIRKLLEIRWILDRIKKKSKLCFTLISLYIIYIVCMTWWNYAKACDAFFHTLLMSMVKLGIAWLQTRQKSAYTPYT